MKNTEAKKEYMRKWRKANKEKIKIHNKKYNESNNEKISEYKKNWTNKNKGKIKTKQQEWYKENKEKVLSNTKKYYKENKETQKEYNKKNKKKIAERVKKYRNDNKEKVLERERKYRETNKEKIKLKKIENNKKPINLLKITIRKGITQAFKRNGFTKKSKTHEILGCSYEEFKLHIEVQFKDWMNWENKGLYNGELNFGWDIDHIEPLANAISEEDVIRLNHYTNLQPLCSKINRDIKRNKIIFF